MTQSNSLVLFDIDGTLLRGAGSHHKQALMEGIRRITGRDTAFDGVDTSGQLDRDLIATLLKASGASDEVILADLDEISHACHEAYHRICLQDLSPFVCRGAREVLGELQAHGAVVGLVTGNLREIGWRKMELAGLRGFFSFGAFSDDGHTRAELARIAFQRALDSGLIAEGCRVSLVGDHRNDIHAAKTNGFQAVAVASGLMSSKELQQYEPDILVESLADLDVAGLLQG